MDMHAVINLTFHMYRVITKIKLWMLNNLDCYLQNLIIQVFISYVYSYVYMYIHVHTVITVVTNSIDDRKKFQF